MNSTNKILLGLLAVQVAAIMGMRATSSNQKLAVRNTELFAALDAAKVQKLSIKGSTEDGKSQNSVTLVKNGEKWVIGNADNFPAKSAEVTALLKTIASLRSHNNVLSGPKYHGKLEVAADKYQRKVTLTHEGKETIFYMGSSPSFKNTHLRLDGQDQVYMVNNLSHSDVGDRAWNWVERNYVNVPEAQLWAIKLTNSHGSLNLEKDPTSGNWTAVGLSGKLKDTEIKGLVAKAREISLETPVSKSEKPEQGFSAPLAMVELTVGSSTIAGTPPASTTIQTIRVGKKVSAENRYFVKSSTSDYVIKAANWAIDPLVNKQASDLIEK